MGQRLALEEPEVKVNKRFCEAALYNQPILRKAFVCPFTSLSSLPVPAMPYDSKEIILLSAEKRRKKYFYVAKTFVLI